MFELEPTGEERLIRETAARFAEAELRGRLREHERDRGVGPDVRARYGGTGFDVLDWPETAGGQGLGTLARALVLEELGAVDAGAALALEGPGLAAAALIEGDREELLREHRGHRGVVIEECGLPARTDKFDKCETSPQ